MHEGLRRQAIVLLSNYLEDLRYWCAMHEAEGINSVTAGTPHQHRYLGPRLSFETLEDANAYRVMVKAVLKELRDV